MTVRMTGMTGLIDTDALVEASLLRYKTKLNTQKQNKMIQEYKQEQYRAIMTQAKEFQNKYLDVLSSNSLFSSSAYNTLKFTSADSTVVSATGSTKAKAGNYKVVVDSMAEPARAKMTSSDFASLSGEITINNQKFTLKEISDPTNLDQIKSRADDLNTKLKNAGMGVTVQYSDFANGGTGGIIFQTEETGTNATLSIEKGSTVTAGTVTAGTNATEKYTASFSIGQLDSNTGVAGKSININGTVIALRDDGYDPNSTETYSDRVIHNLMSDINTMGIDNISTSITENSDGISVKIATPVADGDLSVSYNDGTTDIDATITGGPATKCTSQAISMSDLGSGTTSKMLVVNGKTINTSFDASASDEEKSAAINRALEDAGVKVELKKDDTTGEYKLYSKEAGANNNFSYGVKSIDSSASGNVIAENFTGTNLKGSITDMDTGETIIIDGTEGYGNNITLDEVTFKISDVTGSDGIKITGKQDVTELKDKIVSFVNDYNKLIGAIN
ncbi:MAG: flagellar cap protein FliD N-terminal domain-containing protein, partial [Clostridiaceae bacterium]|nr:flagellar cap protein FliD N-terminal domain-containing protein [Clostridiaceae bacterium]